MPAINSRSVGRGHVTLTMVRTVTMDGDHCVESSQSSPIDSILSDSLATSMLFLSRVVVWSLVLLAISEPGFTGSCKEAHLCCKGRDSSCVVQRAPINSIIEDLNDQPCYCDHACLQLGDCCSDVKEACQVVDCEVSEWSSWSECNIDCGPGVMKRSRFVHRQNHNGGKHCPPLVQRRGCLGTDCPHNPRSALKETAMLLPASLEYSRRSNDTEDITKNLRLRYPKDILEEQRQDNDSEGHKLDKLDKFQAEGTAIFDDGEVRANGPLLQLTIKIKDLHSEEKCVRCELQAMRKSLGYRCPGHGTMGRATRWTALSAHQCYGQWVRLGHFQHAHYQDTCSPCFNRGDFIFV